MIERVPVGNLRVAKVLFDFVNTEALPGTDIDPDSFWAGVDKVVTDLSRQNQELLDRRDELQAQIDKWHRHRVIDPHDPDAYRQFLTEIGYLLPEPDDFTITTANVDPEIATTAGPQLVVPVTNARFALNAANARWGSLYDALYATLADGLHTTLADPAQFAGYTGDPAAPDSVLLVNHGLHIDIVIDPESPVGKTDRAGIKDVILESAVTTIIDFEDAVAAVDAEDKTRAYRNWLGLNKGDLSAEVNKDGRTFTRVLNQDRRYTTPDGGELVLPGRALLFVRNVGHLMTNDAIVDADGNEVFEGIQDALFTGLCAIHGLKSSDVNGPLVNSRTGSIYIVKPKM